MNRNFGTLGTFAALLLGTSTAIAQTEALPGDIEIPSGSLGYVNVGGQAVRTGLGECLKLDNFDEESMVNACEGIDDAAAKSADGEGDADADGASESETVAAEPVAKEPIVTTTTVSGEALFESDSADLSAASEQALAELVAQLERYQEISSIEITGHTDATGEEGYNQELSERRAEAVETYIKAAYPAVNVSSQGLGESSPVATNSTPEGRAQNRRVDVQVTAKSITE
ncbi:MAG: OmpA family protein [Granulosicoccus sp.]|nr:OmpA family protein [Granulosicoccus sp.]